jgi:hypothetical protein
MRPHADFALSFSSQLMLVVETVALLTFRVWLIAVCPRMRRSCDGENAAFLGRFCFKRCRKKAYACP